ncbi:hydroxyacylglutathione hydrolase [Achromobacter sp. GG226]|uniref:hydroxyacylglutathione hydrolase n=1 Tax=Verticiella alkaliphila TaxID=2779529 RepID=UPI001C0C851D|nr:hydroxyacylglutathione hydrolase [Verticiella sp. GG226]MBU4609817.1 hydroxyacylglutathione hydrolase [Verticiella sp. GG226]
MQGKTLSRGALQPEGAAPAGVFGLRAFDDNYIWVVRRGDDVAVVDPGDATPVLEALEMHGLRMVAILLTHHHGDHVGGVMRLLEHAAVPVYGPATERLPHCDFPLREGDRVQFRELDLDLAVLDVPGHTAGHIAYHGRAALAEPVLFCGDTLFASGCGRLFEGTPAQMYASLAKLMALPGETRVYCAHEYTAANVRFACAVEPANADLATWRDTVALLRAEGEPTVPTTLTHELAVNPFLRTAQAAVQAAVSNQAGRPLRGEVDVFGALRAWKDEFR